ncbi:MAG TPA: biopolymer transporter ExbD [Povalibacter sp.]|uniref:ExbD/TolR family protein n=1 Tax=Povalibacter sp. TaxID=1962978 RepID=UPI002C1E1E0D|nr:biopolymer transporter ExbD [Povalibacter sp.]HMN46681.1 biopolymer transporter ExbD [Povalibacter sp.]
MAISARTVGEGEPIADMNTTPLIDVLLVLLIMFIITLPLMTHSTNLQLAGGTPSAVIPEVVYVDIDFDGAVLWNGVLIQDFAQLERLLRQEAARKDQADLQVRPDGRAAYDTVARVLALAQRSGIKRIGVSSADD